jgi:hypothetical protein
MSTAAEARFRDWQVGEVRAKLGDGGLDFLELVGGWGSGIVGYKGGFNLFSQFYGVQGVRNLGEGFIRRNEILTVIFCRSGEGLGDRS